MSNEPFAGFPVPTKNFFSMPNEMINIIAHIKNVAELKVIIYVIRHTWGYHEYGICKMISVDEFQHGRRRSDGSRMDEGTGLSHHSVIDGLKAAVNDGYLICEMDASDLARVKKSYALKMISSSADTSPGAEFAPPEEFAPGAESSNSSANSAPSSEESALRSEKDTIRKTPKKDTKKESNAGSSEPAAPASSSQSKPINFSEAQERKKATDEHKAITQEMLAEKVIAPKITLPSKQKTAASADGEAVVQPPQSQVKGTPDVAPPASVGASTAPAGAGKKRTQEKQPEQVPKCSTKEIQARINAYRGYALEEEVDIIRERRSIKTWCNLHTLEEFDLVLHYLTTQDKYWKLEENKYRIGGLTLLKETPKALAEIAKRQNGKQEAAPDEPELGMSGLPKLHVRRPRYA